MVLSVNKEEVFIKLYSFSFLRGGAAKAANRFFSILSSNFNVEKISVEEHPNKAYKFYHICQRVLSFVLVFFYQWSSGVKCSANIFSFTPLVKNLLPDHSLAHLHWVNNDSLSIFHLNKIPKHSIITLHDEWFYCGVEHYFYGRNTFEASPYFSGNNCCLSGFNSYLHYYVWRVKKNTLRSRSDLIVTTPSEWMANRARNSYVFENCDVRVLYNPINVDIFSPLGSVALNRRRDECVLENRFLILFGAVGGASNKLKGFAELLEALQLLGKDNSLKSKVTLGLFGAEKQDIKELHGFPVIEFGYIKSEQEMAEIYSTAHVTLVPSKLEAFGQVAAESQACGTPVIAFDTSGLKDVVIDGKTGLLAVPFSSESLAEKIDQILTMPSEQYNQLCKNARQHVVDTFSNAVISQQYESIIKEQLLKKQEANK